MLGCFHPLKLSLQPRVRVSPEGSQIDVQVRVLERRAAASAPMPLLQNQAGLHARAIRHRRRHLPRHLGHQVGQAPRSQLRPQPAARLVRQDHSRAYVPVPDVQQQVRALVEPSFGAAKPEHTPAACPHLSRRIRLDAKTALQVAAATQQSHRTIHLLLVVGSRAEPRELFRSHVVIRPQSVPAEIRHPKSQTVLLANPMPQAPMLAGGLMQRHSPIPPRDPRPHRPEGCPMVTAAASAESLGVRGGKAPRQPPHGTHGVSGSRSAGRHAKRGEGKPSKRCGRWWEDGCGLDWLRRLYRLHLFPR